MKKLTIALALLSFFVAGALNAGCGCGRPRPKPKKTQTPTKNPVVEETKPATEQLEEEMHKSKK